MVALDRPRAGRRDSSRRFLTPGREAWLVALLLLLAAGLHAWAYWTGRLVVDGDECYTAIQALDILGGDRPVFYLGQHYMASFEAYLTAWLMVLGAPPWGVTIRGAGLLLTLAYLVTAWWLARRFVSPAVALVALALLVVPPAQLVWWVTKLRGYTQALVLGAATLIALVTMVTPGRRGRRPWMALVLGLLLGVGWWSNPSNGLHLLVAATASLVFTPLRRRWFFGWRRPAVAVANAAVMSAALIVFLRVLAGSRPRAFPDWMWEHRTVLLATAAVLALAGLTALARRRVNRRVALAAAGFVIGCAPMLVVYWTVQNPWNKMGMARPGTLQEYLMIATLDLFPRLTGMVTPEMGRDAVAVHPALAVPAVGVYAMLLYWVARSGRRLGRVAALMLLTIGWLIALGASQGILAYEGRVYLHLYLPLMLLLAMLIVDLGRVQVAVGGGVLLLMLAVHLAGIWKMAREPYDPLTGLNTSEAELVAFVQERGIGLMAIDTGSSDASMRMNLVTRQQVLYFDLNDLFLRVDRWEKAAAGAERFPVAVRRRPDPVERFGREPDFVLEHYLVWMDVESGEVFRYYPRYIRP